METKKITLSLKTIAVFALFSLCVVHGWTASVNDSRRLVDDVITSYDRRVRPIQNQTKPIDVFMTFYLLSVLEVDEVQQRIHINAWVNFSWWDEFRMWQPENYNGISMIHPDPLDVWRPRTILSNSLGPRDIFDDDYAPFTLLSSGATRWYPGSIFYLSCKLDVTYFPFDTQTCKARFVANEQAEEIRVLPTSSEVRKGGYTPNGEWELKETSVFTEEINFLGERLVRVVVQFTIKRRPLYYMINVMFPVMALSLLSSVGFVLPKESGERASFAITVLLSLAVFLGVVSGQLPPSSDTFPIISLYLFKLLCLSSFSVLITVIQLRLAPKLPDGTPQVQDGSSSGSDYETATSEDKENIISRRKKENGVTWREDLASLNDSDELFSISAVDESFRENNHANGSAARISESIKDGKGQSNGVFSGLHSMRLPVQENASSSRKYRKGKTSHPSVLEHPSPNGARKKCSMCCWSVLRVCLNDMILFLVFISLWSIFTIIFVYNISKQANDD